MSKPLLIVIAGPTASGKTNLSIEIARYFNTEIISADSRQCYREMNIGVAKPSLEEIAMVKHHFISSHSIFDKVDVGYYEQYALNVLHTIFSKNNIAVMVGGTGLYIDAVLNGIDNMPSVPEHIRKYIQDNYKDKGLEWLQQQLQIKDPEILKIIDNQNPHRMMRALETVEFTGKSIYTFQYKKNVDRNFKSIKIALALERPLLYDRINTRVDKMIKNGLADEVLSLFPYRRLNALQTVGYKELFDYFDNKTTLDIAIEEIKKNTRRYAKRQITWFKNKDEFKWLSPSNTENILQYIESSKND